MSCSERRSTASIPFSIWSRLWEPSSTESVESPPSDVYMSTSRDESCRCAVLRLFLRDPEVVGVGREVVLDVRELDVREVVSLDRTLQARIELLDLRHHALRLRSLRGDRVCGSGPRSGRRERGCECDD